MIDIKGVVGPTLTDSQWIEDEILTINPANSRAGIGMTINKPSTMAQSSTLFGESPEIPKRKITLETIFERNLPQTNTTIVNNTQAARRTKRIGLDGTISYINNSKTGSDSNIENFEKKR